MRTFLWVGAAAVLLHGACAWTTWKPPLPTRNGSSSSTEVLVTYDLDVSSCASIASRFHEDYMMWGSTRISCAHVESLLQSAADTWARHSCGRVRFLRVEEPSSKEGNRLHFTTRPLSAEDDSEWVASANRLSLTVVEIAYDSDRCWYGEAQSCAGIVGLAANQVAVIVSYAGLVLTFVALVALSVRFPGRLPSPPLVLWHAFCVFVVFVPVAYGFVVFPCAYCHSFEAVTLHELGHALGYGHVDDASSDHACGCGPSFATFASGSDSNATSTCRPPLSRTDSVMYSTTWHSGSTCLTPDDVDGLRHVYAPECCGLPQPCFENHGSSGVARAGIALAISLLAVVCGYTSLACVCSCVRGTGGHGRTGTRNGKRRMDVVKM